LAKPASVAPYSMINGCAHSLCNVSQPLVASQTSKID
jgi:hypothetical protein